MASWCVLNSGGIVGVKGVVKRVGRENGFASVGLDGSMFCDSLEALEAGEVTLEFS